MSSPQIIHLNSLMTSIKDQPIAIEAISYHTWLTFPVKTIHRITEPQFVAPREGRIYISGYYFLNGIVVSGKTLEDAHRKNGSPELVTYKDDAILLKEVYDNMGDPSDQPHFMGWAYVTRDNQDAPISFHTLELEGD